MMYMRIESFLYLAAIFAIIKRTGSSCAGVTCDQQGMVAAPGSIDCSAGTYYDDFTKSCQYCEAGTFSSAGASQCTNCESGTYSSTGASQCTSCHSGTYSSTGASQCTNCSPGTYSVSVGSSQCTSCDAGSYCDNYGCTSCSTCESGTISSPGASTCSLCPAGYYLNSGATSCTPCNPGSYCSGAGCSMCSFCLPGTYTYSYGTTTCSPCSSGLYSSDYGTTTCSTCNAGTYSTSGASSCTQCSSGTASDGGSSTCSATSTSCPSGDYISGSNCRVCSQSDTYCYDGVCNGQCATCATDTYTAGALVIQDDGSGALATYDDDYVDSNVYGAAACTSSASVSCPKSTGKINGYDGCYPCVNGMQNGGHDLHCSYTIGAAIITVIILFGLYIGAIIWVIVAVKMKWISLDESEDDEDYDDEEEEQADATPSNKVLKTQSTERTGRLMSDASEVTDDWQTKTLRLRETSNRHSAIDVSIDGGEDGGDDGAGLSPMHPSLDGHAIAAETPSSTALPVPGVLPSNDIHVDPAQRTISHDCGDLENAYPRTVSGIDSKAMEYNYTPPTIAYPPIECLSTSNPSDQLDNKLEASVLVTQPEKTRGWWHHLIPRPTPSVGGPTPSAAGPTPSAAGPAPSAAGPAPSVAEPASRVTRPAPSVPWPTSRVARPTSRVAGPTPSVTGPTPRVAWPTSVVNLRKLSTAATNKPRNTRQPKKYENIITVKYRKLYGLFKVPPVAYAWIMLLSQLASVILLISSVATSSVISSIEEQVLFLTIFHICVSWIAIPFWQNASIVSKDRLTIVKCEESGCIYCNCCSICISLVCLCGRTKTSLIAIPREDNECRYMPFSLYNLLFMLMNPGKALNPKYRKHADAIPFGTLYFFILSCNIRGALNLYLCINASVKLAASASQGGFSTSVFFALMSLIAAIVELKVYILSLVFGLLITPYTISFALMFFCPGNPETLAATKGSYLEKILRRYWSYMESH